MKLSMMSYTMARLGSGVEDIISTAAGLKMDGIDWVTTYNHDPKDLKKRCNDVGLPVVCHTFFLGKLMKDEKDWLDEAKQSIENALILGAPVVMIPPCGREDMQREEFRCFIIKALKEVVSLTDEAGLTLTVENFPGIKSAFVTADDYLEAKAEIPQLKLTYDNGNATTGEDPIESFRKCADDVVHAHFKDWDILDHAEDGYNKMLNGKYYRPALIGEGDIDTIGTWNAMKEYGYKGYINIEYEGNKYPPAEAVERVVKYLRKLNL